MTDQPLSTLDRLYSIDPKDLTDEQIDQIIAEYRQHFGVFAADEAAGIKPRTPRKAKPKAEEAKAETRDILKDLGLRS
jgi:hypothetical protein